MYGKYTALWLYVIRNLMAGINTVNFPNTQVTHRMCASGDKERLLIHVVSLAKLAKPSQKPVANML